MKAGLERRLEDLEARAVPDEPKGFKVRNWDELEAFHEAGADMERLDLSEAPEPFLRELHDVLTRRKDEISGA